MKLSPALRISGLLALGFLLPSCDGLGQAMADLDNSRLSEPMVLNDTQESALSKIGAIMGKVLGTDDYVARSSGAGDQIEAVKKARSYQNDIEVKGKTKDLDEVIKQTAAVLASPIGSGTSGDTIDIMLIDPVTHESVDNKVYTVPKLDDNTLFQIGGQKAIFTKG